MAKKQPKGVEDSERVRREVESALEGGGDKFRLLLQERALQLASGGKLTEDIIESAYQELIDPKGFVRIQNVISNALQENRIFEKIIYAIIFLIALTGILLLCIGVSHSNDSTATITGAVGGCVTQLLLLPAARYAISVRRHNISIRLVGALIARSTDPKELGPTLERLLLRLLHPRA